MSAYKVVFADLRVKKDFAKALKRLPKPDQQAIYDEMKRLAGDPHPRGTRIKVLTDFSIYGHPATHRLRIGRFRVLYELDERKKEVILLALRKRDESTYH